MESTVSPKNIRGFRCDDWMEFFASKAFLKVDAMGYYYGTISSRMSLKRIAITSYA